MRRAILILWPRALAYFGIGNAARRLGQLTRQRKAAEPSAAITNTGEQP